MKKSKLLLAAPIALLPMVATLPLITSCNKQQADISLSSDLAKNVDVEVISEKLTLGEPYIVSLSIKQDQLGKQYLPNSLTKVKSGDVEQWNIEDYETNGVYDYYRYIPVENNTKAYLYINCVSGGVSIEASTSEMESITATPIEVSGTNKVEYEVGETANTAGRILATAKLKNNDTVILSDYTINLDGFASDHVFETGDVSSTNKTGTISVGDLTSAKFTFIVRNKTKAYFVKEGLLTSSYTKCTSIDEAIATYNAAGVGSYTIAIASDSYVFTKALTTIQQSVGKYLTIKALEDPEIVDWEMSCGVKLQLNTTDDVESLINIVNVDTAATASYNCSITISGIEFLAPTTASTTSYSHIAINASDTATVAPRNITIKKCKFVGKDDGTSTVHTYGVNSLNQTTSGNAYDISMYLCVGQYLGGLFNGYINHDAASLIDLSIATSYLGHSQQLASINSTNASVSIDGVIANVMYHKNDATTLAGALEIVGAGTFWIENSTFNKLATHDTSVDIAGFINTLKGTAAETDVRQINLYNTEFYDEISPSSDIHTILNSNATANYDWNVRVTHELIVQDDTVLGDPNENNFWDIPEW